VEEHSVDLHQQRQDSKAHVEAGADGQAEAGNNLVGGGGKTGYEYHTQAGFQTHKPVWS
jgi:hypothetical protein